MNSRQELQKLITAHCCNNPKDHPDGIGKIPVDEFMDDLLSKFELAPIPIVLKSCDTCEHLITCRFWKEASNNGATCKFYIEY